MLVPLSSLSGTLVVSDCEADVPDFVAESAEEVVVESVGVVVASAGDVVEDAVVPESPVVELVSSWVVEVFSVSSRASL